MNAAAGGAGRNPDFIHVNYDRIVMYLTVESGCQDSFGDGQGGKFGFHFFESGRDGHILRWHNE